MPSKDDIDAARELSAKRQDALREVERALKLALDAGVPADTVARAVILILRESGLFETAEHVLNAIRSRRHS